MTTMNMSHIVRKAYDDFAEVVEERMRRIDPDYRDRDDDALRALFDEVMGEVERDTPNSPLLHPLVEETRCRFENFIFLVPAQRRMCSGMMKSA